MSDNALAYVFRIFWIVLLAFILVDSFCKSWNTENGKKERVLSDGGRSWATILSCSLLLLQYIWHCV